MFTCRDTDNNPQGEYVAASTFMPHPYCNVSGDGKVYIAIIETRPGDNCLFQYKRDTNITIRGNTARVEGYGMALSPPPFFRGNASYL